MFNSFAFDINSSHLGNKLPFPFEVSFRSPALKLDIIVLMFSKSDFSNLDFRSEINEIISLNMKIGPSVRMLSQILTQ